MCENFNSANVSLRGSPLRARDIVGQLQSLIEESTSIEPNLARKLSRVQSWISRKKEGLLTRKKYVMSFLTELVIDSEVYLKLKQASPEVKQRVMKNMTSVEKWWYEQLFPTWLNQSHDPNYNIWTKKLMGEKYKPTDEAIIACIAEAVKKSGGSFLWRYILDLSMANDLLISIQQGVPLCVQITTMSMENVERSGKRYQWELDCCQWGINQGVFAILNPQKLCKEVKSIARELLRYSRYSDNISGRQYILYFQE